jgi:hypothetical protein
MEPTSAYQRWHRYFGDRRALPLDAPFDEPLPDAPGREAIARSLARFELGESGDGQRLRRLAAETGDETYAETIEWFVKEENAHARWLGMLRERFGGERLTSHWSDHAFVVLRHIGALRFEICVLLSAEVTALTYYRVLGEAHPDPVLRAACKRILLDERGHVAFHRATLGREFASLRGVERRAAALAWRSFVVATATVVALDHREVLELAGVSRGEFVGDVRRRARQLARVMYRPGAFEQPAVQ